MAASQGNSDLINWSLSSAEPNNKYFPVIRDRLSLALEVFMGNPSAVVIATGKNWTQSVPKRILAMMWPEKC